DFVTFIQLSTFNDSQVGKRRVLIKRNALDQTRSEAAVTLVEVLANRHGGANAIDARQVGRMSHRHSEGLSSAKANRALRTKQDLGADVGFAPSAVPQESVGQTNRKNHKQDTEGDAGDADSGARGAMSYIR